jgi:hypothetical protein
MTFQKEVNQYAFEPSTFAQLEWWADKIWQSAIIPESIKKKEHVFIIIATGRELGFTMMQSLRWLYIVNGRVALWTAAKVALIQQSPLCEYFHVVESTDKICTVRFKRKGNPERLATWTIDDAIRAKLANDPKRDPWVKYPKKMLMWRCESDAADEGFPDVAGGLMTVESARDMDAMEVVDRTADVQLPPVAITPSLPSAPVAAGPSLPRTPEPVSDAEGNRAPEPVEDRAEAKEAAALDPTPPPAEETPTNPVLGELTKLIAAAKDIPTIVAAKDAILKAATEGTIGADDVKPLIVLLLGRCGSPADRNRVSEIVVALRGSGKLTNEQIAALRAEFEKAKKNGGAS